MKAPQGLKVKLDEPSIQELPTLRGRKFRFKQTNKQTNKQTKKTVAKRIGFQENNQI